MAHLPRYYHKAAALMAVHESYELVFCFSILRNRWTGHHAGEDFVKFGDKSDKQVENSENPSTYWRQGRTDCLKLASPIKNSSKTGEFSGFVQIFCFALFIAILFWSQSGEFSAKNQKKKHIAMYALSQLGTRVSKVYK
jgi:hypothetical protein